ncbi:glycoside hydrolase family 38 C-terminal domain-containing protein [Actinomyces slackii]|uniref:Mannosylglycerate hydrolase n=1 Tax=Actinomyces slackii TaxID=52774 RepID=A0A3S5EM25_9ACTO|nr:glycoside hydrolase family 38 C-terminal domain-containing protein [Actinomyces slackii]VEG73774.1 Mannosylglycerate hydrolase [Actinomyces slackii]
MHTNPQLTEQRAARTLEQRIIPAIHTAVEPLELSAWSTEEPVPFSQAAQQDYRPIAVGAPWGPPWSTTWLHATGSVPAGWRQREGCAVELVVDLGFTTTQPGFQAEGLLRRADGSAIKAVSPRNQSASWSGEPDAVDIYIEAAANPDVAGGFGFAPTPYGYRETAGSEPLYTLRRVDLALRDLTVWELAQDLTVLLQLAAALPLDSTRRARIDLALERAIDEVDPLDISGTAAAARARLAGVLASPAHASAHHVIATGHAHIDSAWLWPVRETVRKCIRTFSSVLALMEEDPDFVFACSSAQQYAWVKEHDPGLYERIRQRVAEGRFIPVGGMWLEADTNMPGSEAMARQMIEGKSFFLAEFGVETLDVWLPDSFGYTGSLPGIIRAAGSRWFLSQKLSWNDTDAMPHHTFTWEGIDGSRVLTHFPPVDSYNSALSVSDLLHAEANFKEKAVASSSIVPFGYGDGGGGPTREMLAAARRFADLEAVPTVEQASPNTFFERTEADQETQGGLPVWSGEMYLEFHRGTYTSQLRTKQGNRRSEHLLREAELWAATAAVRQGADYPYELLKDCWRTVLRNQFHDILPGTCIGWVYQRTEAEYAQVAADLEAVIDSSAAALVGQGSQELCLNAAPSPRDGVPSLGIGPATAWEGDGVVIEQDEGTTVLDNGLLRVTIDGAGLIVSLVDLEAGREVLAEGQAAGLLQLHRDLPRQWDAWDIDREYRNTVEDVTGVSDLSVERRGAQAVVRLSRPLGQDSSVAQEIRLSPGSKQVVLDLDIDWHERQRLLKLAFPLDLKADASTAEMQFGHVSRPTHQNTSWDAARYEICAHRWIHVGEEGYGVAVLNDSTYGHDVTRGVDRLGRPTTTVRLSLVRAPLFPDPQADQGRHRLSVALRPGAEIGQAVTEGYAFNLPRRTVLGGREVEPLVEVEGLGVVVEAVKLAEDRSGDVIVRLYESRGARTRATLSAGFPVEGIEAVDLLERPDQGAGAQLEAGDGQSAGDAGDAGDSVSFELRPFQILSLRLRR